VTEPNPVHIASSEVIRDINKRTVLNLIRTRQPISRADLARASGMQRSTISLIVEELVDGKWVIEGATGRLPRGRRPTFLWLNEERVIIAIDIRPGQMVVALSDVNGKFTLQETIPTPRDPQVAIRALIRQIGRLTKLCAGKKIEGVGISLPGWYDAASARLVFAPNLGWRDVDLRTPIAKATGLDVELENAANACVLAVVWFDRMAACRDAVVVTVSEGIGAGVLANGQLMRGLRGMAGEFGHIPLDPLGPLCNCGSRGCWEVFGSNRAALRYLAESGGSQSEMAFPELLALADDGDKPALAALRKMAHHLGQGMRIIVAGLAPERIVIIGDLTRSWKLFEPIIQAEVAAQALPGAPVPVIVPAHEDGMARLRGTVALVLQKHFHARMVSRPEMEIDGRG